MREIEFRAKGLYKDRWYYGFYVEHKRAMQSYIIDLDEEDMSTDHFVNKDTLGQYTGLCDKNGTKIFEGDIVRGKDYGGLRREGIVEFDKYSSSYNIIPKTKSQYRECNTISSLCPSEEYLEVIGNIYDNPELLGGQNG